ncbi:MAG TPA: hypothetical protein VFA54_15030 [Bryobacterales bacterium]|jgi:hypothetical protein|nr:hypothetical protein [Bryobacterales bacterium]
MNCQDFEAIVNDLARDQLILVADRARALVHTETCARCAARLADERMLTAELRALAAGSESQEAPAPVEEALLRAFRRQKAASGAVAAKGRAWVGAVAVGALAAAMLILLALTIPALRRNGPPEPKPAEGLRETKPPRKQRIEVAEAPVIDDSMLAGDETAAAQLLPIDLTAGLLNSALDVFVPLHYGETLSDLDGDRVVRVELPYSALISLGVSMDEDAGNDGIEADLLLGDDGLAHAIRLIR